MDAKVIVRPASSNDVEALAQLHVSTWRETYSELVPKSFFSEKVVDHRRRMWAEWIQDRESDRVIRVAEINGTVEGFAAAGAAMSDPAPRARELYMIYVAKSWHGSGAGQSLLDAVLGEQSAFLWVAKQNPRAHAFYTRNGFKPDGGEQVDPRAEKLVEVRLVR
ncbi:GNAT family N-acetyltransferase [Cryobacterium tagatosivorans]|uniref:GNAT family N-acetyltransferase n=1 Tax=Cryobacterium tagatosivorans TaxID=1259199 RepID=A0A4V3I6I6_9MICO|nr:GNAT family N-acetyltransferase [Cryobacterium tagatosivorans]TFB51973.1 GNAT family N-acetyltransferase [Cryobacterium tagatosivorans]